MKRTALALTAAVAAMLPLTATPATAAPNTVQCQVDTVDPYEYKVDWVRAIVDVVCRNHPGLVMLRGRMFEVVPRSVNRSQLKAVGPWVEDSGERQASVYPTGVCSGGSAAKYLAYWEAIAWPHALMDDEIDGWTKAGATGIKVINCTDRRFGRRPAERSVGGIPNQGISQYRPVDAWLIPNQRNPRDCDMVLFGRCLW